MHAVRLELLIDINEGFFQCGLNVSCILWIWVGKQKRHDYLFDWWLLASKPRRQPFEQLELDLAQTWEMKQFKKFDFSP